MRYIGNKTKLLPFIETAVRNHYPDLSSLVFCDLFAGSCSVGRHFKDKVGTVISNDLETYSKCLADNYIVTDGPPQGWEAEVEYLNALAPRTGRLSLAFSPEGPAGRMFFTSANARKIQAIREKIEEYTLDQDMYRFLLCSLLESADAFANTTGVYGAFLKKFNSRSAAEFHLQGFVAPPGTGVSLRGDATKVVDNLQGDVLYLDPPYNARQYSSNYHILNCIVNFNDFQIKNVTKGDITQESKSGLTTELHASEFSMKRTGRAYGALEELIENARGFETIFMSYNNEGILSFEEIKSLFQAHGDYSVTTQAHKRYKSNSRVAAAKDITEYIHVLRRR